MTLRANSVDAGRIATLAGDGPVRIVGPQLDERTRGGKANRLAVQRVLPSAEVATLTAYADCYEVLLRIEPAVEFHEVADVSTDRRELRKLGAQSSRSSSDHRCWKPNEHRLEHPVRIRKRVVAVHAD